MHKKRMLVTGGFGFIGGHLVELLLKQGCFVHVVDDLSNNPVPLKVLLDELGNPKELTYSITTIEEFFKKAWYLEVDGIFHLASPVGPAGVLKHAGKMVKQIVNDTYRVMDLAMYYGVRLVDVSTSEIYGGGVNGFCTEACDRIISHKTSVRLEYSVAKLAAETALINTSRVAKLDACIVRPFNVTGKRQSSKGGFVLPRFIEQALDGSDLTVFGDGTQIRAFTNVTEIVEGLDRVMDMGRSGEAYNLGNPRNKISILGLANEVIDLVGNKNRIAFVDPKTIHGP